MFINRRVLLISISSLVFHSSVMAKGAHPIGPFMPGAPSKIQALPMAGSGVTVSWQRNETTAVWYQISADYVSYLHGNVTQKTWLVQAPANEYIDTFPQNGDYATYKVAACDDEGCVVNSLLSAKTQILPSGEFKISGRVLYSDDYNPVAGATVTLEQTAANFGQSRFFYSSELLNSPTTLVSYVPALNRKLNELTVIVRPYEYRLPQGDLSLIHPDGTEVLLYSSRNGEKPILVLSSHDVGSPLANLLYKRINGDWKLKLTNSDGMENPFLVEIHHITAPENSFSTLTDADGKYSFSNVPIGLSYSIGANKAGMQFDSTPVDAISDISHKHVFGHTIGN